MAYILELNGKMTVSIYDWLVALDTFLFSSVPGEMIQFD